MCFTFKKNNKWTKNPVDYFLHDNASAGMRSPETSVGMEWMDFRGINDLLIQ